MSICCKKIDFRNNLVDEMYLCAESEIEQKIIQDNFGKHLNDNTSRILFALKNVNKLPEEDVQAEIAELICKCQEEIVDSVEKYVTNHENIIPAVSWDEEKNRLVCKFYYYSLDSYLH